MAEEFTGFANTGVDKKGKAVDAREVKAFVDKTEAGKVRTATQTTPSSIAVKAAEAKASTETAPAAEGEEVSGS